MYKKIYRENKGEIYYIIEGLNDASQRESLKREKKKRV
jgi:hypothetical protein